MALLRRLRMVGDGEEYLEKKNVLALQALYLNKYS